MDKPIEETIKALLSFVIRQFYPNSYVLVLDAIMFHSVLSEEDLAHLLGIKRPELRSLITVLLEDRILARHSQQEFAVNSRSVKRYYYYIKYPQAIDAIKWKVHQIVAKLKDDLDKNSTPQGYICPLCSTRFTQLEAIALLNYERTQFVCSLCEEPLVEDDSGKRSKEKQGRLNRLMDQVQPIIDYLKKIDDNMIEENTFETALARLIPPQNNSVAQYTLNPRARKSRMFVPGDVTMGNDNSRKAGVKSQATLHVNITTQYDELYQQDQQEKQAEEKRKQNALPAWHEKSTIGESALGNLRDEYDMSSGIKIENDEETEGQQQQQQQQQQQPPQRQQEHLQLLSNIPQQQQQQQQLSTQQADSLHWNVKPDFAQLLDLNDFNLQNLICVSPSDAKLLSLPNLNAKPNTSATELKNWVPLLKPYDINWRNFVWIDMLQLLEKEDPFQTAYKSVNPIAISEIRIDDPNLTNFIWRFACTTLIAGNFLLFPHDRFDTFMRCLWSLNEKHTIVQDAIRYDISVFMQDVYENAKLHHFSQIWDRYVRALSFKQVLGTINERIQNSQDFVEYVCLTFTVFLMFFANSALRSNLWRTHLRGCQQLLIRASILMPKGQLTDLEQNAADIYSVLRDWFCHAETAASIASNFGISLIDITEFTKTAFLTESSPLSLTGNSFNLLKGMSNNLNSVYFHLLLRMFEFKDKGVDISGLNIFLFKVNGTTKSVLPQLSMFGRELLDELQRSAVLDSNLELNLIDVTDLRLKFSMLASHSMFYFLMEVYLKVYFLDVDPKSPEIKSILYTMVKTSYSNPYYSSCGVCCHPSLFVGALTCIIAEDDVLYVHFIDLLSKITDSGMAVAKNSVDKLNAIKANVAIGAYQNIINPDHDFIPI